MKPLVCPRCLGKNIDRTQLGKIDLGGLTPSTNLWDLSPTLDPNKVKCRSCQHQGNAGDWRLIVSLREDLRPFAMETLRQALADFAAQEAQQREGAAVFGP